MNMNLNTRNKHQEHDVGDGKAPPAYPVATLARKDDVMKPGRNTSSRTLRGTLRNALLAVIYEEITCTADAHHDIE